MGGMQSKPEIKDPSAEKKNPNAEFKDLTVVVDDGIKKKLTELGEYVSIFNSNDVKPLIKIVKDYKINLETSTGQRFNFANIDNSVGQFHRELLEKISTDNENISAEEKDKKFSELLKSKALPDYLKNMYDVRLSKLKTKILEDPIVSKDTEMKNNIGQILTDITGIKSKYKYFEYRYIQLNLFLIIFIQHTYNTMDNFIKSILAYTVNRDKMREDSLRDLINLLLKIMKEAELNITQKDFESIDNLMSVSEMQIKKRQEQLDKAIEKARVGAIDEMLKLVMINHDIFSHKLTNNDSTKISSEETKGSEQNDILKKFGINDSDRLKEEQKIREQINEQRRKDYERREKEKRIEQQRRDLLNRGVRQQPFFSNNEIRNINRLDLPRRANTNPTDRNRRPYNNIDRNRRPYNTDEDTFDGGFIRDRSLLPQTFYEISN